MADDFWIEKENSGELAVRTVMAIAVYRNVTGDIAIRQQDAMGDEDDIIYVPVSQVQAVIEALQKAAGLPA